MICPHCNATVDLTWKRYWSAPTGGHQCPQCSNLFQLSTTFGQILLRLGMALSILAIVLLAEDYLNTSEYSLYIGLFLLAFVGFPLDKIIDNRWRKAVKATQKQKKTHFYKTILIVIAVFVAIDFYFTPFIYALYLVGVYPVKAQVKDVAIEFKGHWLPTISNESTLEFLRPQNKSHINPSTLFNKIDLFKPNADEELLVMWIGDKSNKPDDVYSNSIHYDWGTAYIIKKELTTDQNRFFAVVPEYKVLISAESLDQLKDIKKLTIISAMGKT